MLIKKNKKTQIIYGILILFCAVYFPSFFYWIFLGNVNTDIIKYGSIEDSIDTEAYIVRNEYVLNADQGGTFFSEVNEGERVQAYAKVASILNDKDKNMILELNKKEQSILENYHLIAQKRGEASFAVQNIDNEISKLISEITMACNNNNISQVLDLKIQTESLIKKKVQIISQSLISDTNFNRINQERNMIKRNIEKNAIQITVPSSGMVSYTVDGNENLFSPQNVKNIKISDFNKIVDSSIFLVSEDSRIEKDKPFAKIITDNQYFILFPLDDKVASKFKNNEDLMMRIIEIDRTLYGKVYNVSEESNGKKIVAVEMDKALSELTYHRKINLNIIKNSYNGFKIPVKSLINFDKNSKKAKVMLVKAGVTKLIDVNVLGFNEDFAILSNSAIKFSNGINLYDTFVVDGKNVKEDQFIN